MHLGGSDPSILIPSCVEGVRTSCDQNHAFRRASVSLRLNCAAVSYFEWLRASYQDRMSPHIASPYIYSTETDRSTTLSGFRGNIRARVRARHACSSATYALGSSRAHCDKV